MAEKTPPDLQVVRQSPALNGDKKEKTIDRVLDWAYKIVTIAMVPLVVWVFSVERRIAATNTEIAVQKQRNATYQEKLDALKSISDKINELVGKNNVAVIKLTGEFNVVNTNIKNIKDNVQRLDSLGRKLDELLKK